MPSDNPVISAPKKFTEPKYSGEKNKASVPKFFKKLLATVLNKMYQKISST